MDKHTSIGGGLPPQRLEDVQQDAIFNPEHYAIQSIPQQPYTNSHTSIEQSMSGILSQYSTGWSSAETRSRVEQIGHDNQHWSMPSSASSTSRGSDNSVFSGYHFRDSMSSTRTSISIASEPSRDHHILQAQQILAGNHGLETLPRRGSHDAPHQSHSHSRNSSLSRSPENPFSTCVSKTKRSRRTEKVLRYWCTACKEGFGEKYDWKRHEETYQERRNIYPCPNCTKAYFLEKDFVKHHKEGHKCQTCTEQRHAHHARQRRNGRTHWGCGFCPRLDTDWTERCNHIASHFEQGASMEKDWKHSLVILSLLQQPLIRDEWNRLLSGKNKPNPHFCWNQHTTGRAEGYPDSELPPQLQDLLEHFTTDQDPRAIVELAYTKSNTRLLAAQQAQRATGFPIPPKPSRSLSSTTATPHIENTASTQSQWSQNSPPNDKPLPPVPQEPQMNEFANWAHFTNTIIEDSVLPDTSFLMDIQEIEQSSLYFPSGNHMEAF